MVYYGRNTVKSVIDSLGLVTRSETEKRFNCLCPFHGNTDSPAFSISNEEGLWICFNESCAERGNLEQLVMSVTDRTGPEALRFISSKQGSSPELSDLLGEMFAPEPEWPMFPEQIVLELSELFWKTPSAMEYMSGRGFDDATLRAFQIGYSPKDGGQIVNPVHTPDGKTCVGIVGRGIERKFFDNSKNMPKKKVLYNLHRARRTSNSVVVVESGFDAMRIHQAGHPNVVATLGAAVSNEQISLLDRNFSTVVLFCDNDDAGMAMRRKIELGIKSAGVLHAAFDYDTLFPMEGLSNCVPKDAGDLKLTQITKMIMNSMTSYEAGIRRIE
jgi:DNA primase